MENLDSYLKKKLKSKNMKIDTFIKKTKMSKSTIYRVMKGLQKPSDDLIEKIAEVLNLSQIEKRELIYYSNVSTSDEGLTSARNAVLKLLYDTSIDVHTEDLELIYYDKEKYVRYFNDILHTILKICTKNNFKIDFRIINCNTDFITSSLINFIPKLGKKTDNYCIQHLVSLALDSPKDSINILSEVLPLLQLDNYSLYYNDSSSTGNIGIFNNLLIISYKYEDDNGEIISTHNYISFPEDGLPACYVSRNENYLYEFFDRNYNSLIQEYKLAVNNRKEYEFLGYELAKLENEYEVFLFKPDPCYNRIPIEVYKDIIEKTSKDELKVFLNNLSTNNFNDNGTLDFMPELISYLENRIKSSFKNIQVDIFTKKGLEEFAKSGRLSDHLIGLPSFTKEEVKIILEFIKSRHVDKKDPYRFYIVENEYNNNEFILTVFKNYGLFIEYCNPNSHANNYPHCFIEHKELSDIFAEFADNYVPTMITMDTKKSIEFIDSLITEYC